MEEMVGTAAAEDCRVPHLPPPDQLAGAGGEEKGLPPADHRPLVAAVRTKTDSLFSIASALASKLILHHTPHDPKLKKG